MSVSLMKPSLSWSFSSRAPCPKARRGQATWPAATANVPALDSRNPRRLAPARFVPALIVFAIGTVVLRRLHGGAGPLRSLPANKKEPHPKDRLSASSLLSGVAPILRCTVRCPHRHRLRCHALKVRANCTHQGKMRDFNKLSAGSREVGASGIACRCRTLRAFCAKQQRTPPGYRAHEMGQLARWPPIRRAGRRRTRKVTECRPPARPLSGRYEAKQSARTADLAVIEPPASNLRHPGAAGARQGARGHRLGPMHLRACSRNGS